jgi:hypothetical protein
MMRAHRSRGTRTLAVLGALFALGPELAAQVRASPLDSARAEIEGARIEVQYGAPSMRGRAIFGGLVPFGSVWRTGANEATHLRTSSDLVVGTERIPAGEYTLYSIPEPDGWTLIVNRQTGQWGTAYDQRQDLVRLSIPIDVLPEPLETFRISIVEGTESDGEIRFEWESTRATLRFDVAGGG